MTSRRHAVWLVLALVSGSALRAATEPVDSYQIINQYPHDPGAFTQGLVYEGGRLFESTGLYGSSSLRRVDLQTGAVLQIHSVPAQYFAEGMTIFQGKIFQVTWQEQTGFIYDPDTFALLGQFSYAGEGWGLTHDAQHLILSDGTNRIRFLDPVTFQTVGSIDVVDSQSQPLMNINELEYINGEIYANVWQTNLIVRINPNTGTILGWIDLTGLLPAGTPADVLNGIAYDAATGHLLVTGKLWPWLFEIVVTTPGNVPTASFVGMDSTSQGQWVGHYGSAGYVVVNGATNLPPTAVSVSGAATWTWANPTADPRGLVGIGGGPAIAATWYGNSFTIDVDPGSGGQPRRVALYMVDWDNNGRSQTVEVLNPTSGAVLDVRTITAFTGGQYWIWEITGPVRLRITRTGGANAVVSGVFLDPPSPSGGPSASFVGIDSTSQGQWVGQYGSAGYVVVNGATNLPPPAAVNVGGAATWTWANPTADPRGLVGIGGAPAIAATWYGESFTIDVDPGSGGQPRRVALYVVDWDNNSRSQTVEVLNPSTGTVLDGRTITAFTGGQYWIWEITGPVRLRVTRTAGANAVVSGVFLDSP